MNTGVGGYTQKKKLFYISVPCFRSEYLQVKLLGRRCLLMWAIAVTSWMSDRLQCGFWLSIGFPYLHRLVVREEPMVSARYEWITSGDLCLV